jgi:hypothetical protein
VIFGGILCDDKAFFALSQFPVINCTSAFERFRKKFLDLHIVNFVRITRPGIAQQANLGIILYK